MKNKQTVLVIDDQPDFVQIISQQLEHWGYRVLTAPDGPQGLAVAVESQPDLILLDILMPKMKGREVCAHLKANRKTMKVPVIFLSALEMAEHIKAGLALGAEDYVVKPYQPEDLRKRIETCLMKHPKESTTESPPPK